MTAADGHRRHVGEEKNLEHSVHRLQSAFTQANKLLAWFPTRLNWFKKKKKMKQFSSLFDSVCVRSELYERSKECVYTLDSINDRFGLIEVT